jgi:hypothetical protein
MTTASAKLVTNGEVECAQASDGNPFSLGLTVVAAGFGEVVACTLSRVPTSGAGLTTDNGAVFTDSWPQKFTSEPKD